MAFCDRIFLWHSHVPAISSRGSVYPWYLPMSMCPCGLQYVPVAVCPFGLRCLPVAVYPRCIFQWQCVPAVSSCCNVSAVSSCGSVFPRSAVSSSGSVSMLYLPVAVCPCCIFPWQCVNALSSSGSVFLWYLYLSVCSRDILPWQGVPWYPPVAQCPVVSSCGRCTCSILP